MQKGDGDQRGCARRLATISQDGIARAVRPAHTAFDGDTIFSMATCQKEADPNAVGALAAEAVEGAMVRAVAQASSLCGFISYSDILKKAAQP